MTDQQMEDLVERIIQRLRPPVLVMVTAAAGYRHAIRQRLAGCGERLHLALDSGIDDGEQWRAIGKTLPAADWQQELPSASYKALLLPFLDYPLAADLVKGSLHGPVTRRVHDALLSGLPVLALRYHCDPASELNQLRGAQPDSAYAGQLGVTTGILPWNFPFFLIARKLAPALITGNTIVIKPSEFTPNNAIAFAQIVHDIGLPKGVFNLVLGRGETVGQELASNPKVAMVSMTGSVAAGEKIMAAAAKNITKVCLELGGKAPAIVMDDADLELAVKAVVDSRVINSGQVCNCVERVYVQKGIYDRFVNRLGEALKAVQFGDPASRDDIAMGPLINAAALERVEQKVAKAVAQGARVVLGGKAVTGKGYFYPPTLLLDVRQEMDIVHEETFGPVLPVVAFDTLEEALAMANDSDYGLTSSIYTRDLNVAMKAIKGLKFGETYINRENFEAMQGFHAGWRKSGIGGADGRHGLNEYLQTQVVYLQA